MKKWITKLIDQFDLDLNQKSDAAASSEQVNEERATIIYIIDTLNKNLMEIDSRPVRKVRQALDKFAKELLDPTRQDSDRVLFKFRQFISSYRIDEYSYIQKTFDEFRTIIWEFVDQLSDDLNWERVADQSVQKSLKELKEAVESNSIDDLKQQSRIFIDSYVEYQAKKDNRNINRLENVRKNLSVVKKKLVEANHNLLRDHLTSAYNRKSFDEKATEHHRMFSVSGTPVSLITIDIDHFKQFNDKYGHAIGDFVLIECVKLMENIFSRDSDFVARVGGEEFAIILPDYSIINAMARAEEALKKIAEEVFVQDNYKLSFTVSMGVAELQEGECLEEWIKRSDVALNVSKKSGRNRVTAALPTNKSSAA